MYTRYLVLGGAGLVGLQVCRQITENLRPERIVVGSLLEGEARDACAQLREEYSDREVSYVPVWGDLFVPRDLAFSPRKAVVGDRERRRELLELLYGPFETAYERNHLVGIIREQQPEVIVDCVNTATGLSYQNVFDGAQKVRDSLSGGESEALRDDVEGFLLAQSVPQLIRHVRFVYRATTEVGTRVYLKCGTTGTGGMGLNIPYTHSEDKPSKQLLAKTEAAFGHTGLLFLLARTPEAPIVKEVKPAAMIGYRAVRTVVAQDKHGNDRLFEPQQLELGADVVLREEEERYEGTGHLELTVVDTGENGLFTRGEFTAITALGQMEYVTPEEIAAVVVREIRGANTGQDVISALDGAVMNPSYKAGLVRSVALSDLEAAEGDTDLPSVAIGRLGPPELSKLLFEAQLLKEVYGSQLDAIASDGEQPHDPEQMSEALVARLEHSAVRHMAPSIGIPILLPDGRQLLRGPRINVPEVTGHRTTVSSADLGRVDAWARKGWIDLRPENMERWSARARKMVDARTRLRDAGSAVASRRSYLPVTFEIGEVVAWIFNNELGGHRVK